MSATLPFSEKQKVLVNPSEVVDDITINRCAGRLLTNDKKLLEYVNNIQTTSGQNGLIVSINAETGGGNIAIDIAALNAQLSSYYPDPGSWYLSGMRDVSATVPINNGDMVVYTALSGMFVTSGVGTLTSGHNLESHLNISLNGTLQDGQALVYNSSNQKFVNEYVGGSYRSVLKYKTASSDITQYTSNHVYNISSISFDGSSLSGDTYKKLKSIFLECSATTVGSTTSRIAALMGSQYVALVETSNSNASTNVSNKFIVNVPVDQTTYTVAITGVYPSGTGFKLVGGWYEDIEQVYQDVEIILLQGSCDATKADNILGYIYSGTVGLAGFNNWMSLSGNNKDIYLSAGFLPLNVNTDTTKTEIEYFGNSNYASNNNSNGNIVIDWNNSTVAGEFNITEGTNFRSWFLSGNVNSEVSGIVLNSGGTPTSYDTLPVLKTVSTGTAYSIDKLPKIDSGAAPTKSTTNYSYCIKNYKTVFYPTA